MGVNFALKTLYEKRQSLIKGAAALQQTFYRPSETGAVLQKKKLCHSIINRPCVAKTVLQTPPLIMNRPCVAGALLQTPLSLSKGRPPCADLRYGVKDNISPSTLVFATRKG